MNTFYMVVIIAVSMALGALISARVGYVLSCKWNLNSDNTGFLCVVPAIASAIILGVSSYALMQMGGLIYGLAGCILAVPATGMAWVFIVGGNKAIEKILSGLLAKVG